MFTSDVAANRCLSAQWNYLFQRWILSVISGDRFYEIGSWPIRLGFLHWLFYLHSLLKIFMNKEYMIMLSWISILLEVLTFIIVITERGLGGNGS